MRVPAGTLFKHLEKATRGEIMNLNKKTIAILVSIAVMVLIGTSLLFVLGNDEERDKTNGQNTEITTETQDVFTQEEFGTEEFHTEEIGTEIFEESNTSEPKDDIQKDNTDTSNEGENKRDESTGNDTNSIPPTSEPQKPASPEATFPSEKEEEPHVVGQYWEAELGDFEPYKYGVTRSLVRDIEYYEYSDGTSKDISVYEYYDYDCSGYNATDAELKAESESAAASYIDYYNEVLRLTNEVRAAAGVAPLTLDSTLCKAASMRALEMDYAQIFSHTRPNGSSCFSTMDFFGCTYTTCGENIAAGYNSPEDVVEGWKNSPGHYANMIDPDFTKLGVGYTPTNVEGEYWYYWTQLFSN